MFTIKEAAERAELSPDVLRAWERRYGVIRPARTASGYRLYDEADIRRLRAMHRLIEDGFKPREAAAYLDRARNGGAQATSPGASRGSDAAQARRAGAEAGWADGGEPFITAARTLDAPALSAYFDVLGALGTFETVCEQTLFPALRALGEAWADGIVSVAGEHAASAAAMRWLGAQFQAAARDTRQPQVVVALPPGAHHELGALAHAVTLRRRGLDALYLGADLPANDLVVALRATGARLAVVGAIVQEDARAAERVAATVTRALPGVRLAFGGAQAAALGAYGTVLPEGLTTSASAVRELLAR